MICRKTSRTKVHKHPTSFEPWAAISFLIFLMTIAFIIYPFYNLFLQSFKSTSGILSLEHYRNFFSTPYYYKVLFNSLYISFFSTIFAALLGIPMAYFVTRYNILGKKMINLMVILSLMSPPFIGAYSWILLLGRNGFLTRLLNSIGINIPSIYGPVGIILVFTLKFYPYIYLYVSGAINSIDSSMEEAAENLGVHGIKKLFTITFPLILPTILAGALMVFMSSLADFGTPVLIGEGFKVLPVLIYQEYMSEVGGNATFASAVSVIIVIISTLMLLFQKKVVENRNYNMSVLRPPAIIKLKQPVQILLSAICFMVAFISMSQQIVVVITSFIKTSGPIFVRGFSTASYITVMHKLGHNIFNTFSYATISIIIMIILGMLISYINVRKPSKLSNVVDTLMMVPYVIPGSVLGLSLLIAFNRKPILLSGTMFIMIIAYVVRKIPYTVRSSTAILYQLDANIEEASINLGVTPLKTFFKITARLMAPGVISGAMLSWIATINELSSSIILYTGKTSTISVAIYTEVVRGSFGTAAALSSMLTMATIVSILIINKISGVQNVSI
ncbi:iron ABC transporter permease [Biomaibacter acetigenes]|uniref:Iron ABC transporter permease n=1 Tax=Biomaibacter acetigenes TaxID=2316383 RepID=A0A3G2R7V5_9FIRM|nr:iron ABC transporter permease [Biomaibacter acetigenes]